ncbi:hypothetical protein Gotri_021851, partial [Gossypium trilobum]|nr:hypothetical protein [Gossypium trilobum]
MASERNSALQVFGKTLGR